MATPSTDSFLANLFDRLQTSFWFIPGTMLVGSMLLAGVALSVDSAYDSEISVWVPGLEIESPAGAQLLVSTLAGSLITLTGVVFSITVVALTLASQQFGPRLLRGFMRDRATQAVLGVFVSTSLYCLLILFSIRDRVHDPFVPQLSLLLSLVLAILAICALVFFLHHVSTSIHATDVVEGVVDEFERQVDALFPEPLGTGAPGADESLDTLMARFAGDRAASITATGSGYVRLVDDHRLMEIVGQRDLLVELVATPGCFVVEGCVLFRVADSKPVDEELVAALRACVVVGERRTPLQDVEFSIDQLVEVGLRALSPGVNDPHTAISCVHRLGQGLARLARRSIPAAVRHGDRGTPRVIARGITFQRAVEASFVRLHAAADRAAEVRDAIQATIA